MTMHKSKGLEFPFCFYPGLEKSYNLKDIHQGTLFDKAYGLVLKANFDGFIDTIWHKLIRYKQKKAAISEKIRLFYVALTRTKEKMFFVLNKARCKEFEITYENNYISPSIRSGFRMYHDFFDALSLTNAWEVPNAYDYHRALFVSKKHEVHAVEPIRFETIEVLPKKIVQTHFSKSMKRWMDETTKQSIQQGKRLHKVFETFDFSQPSIAFNTLNPENAFYIKRFLSHPELKSIEQATVYQEYPFTQTLQETAKMGVIDLLIVYQDHIDIFDYKLKNISDEAYIMQLKGYQDYIHDLTQKPVNIYLYSIIDDVIQSLGGKT